jgi:hypothetical protein
VKTATLGIPDPLAKGLTAELAQNVLLQPALARLLLSFKSFRLVQPKGAQV